MIAYLESARADCRANGVVANEQEKIDWLVVVDGFLEPLLLDHIGSLDDLGNVAVSGKVE